MLISLLLAGLAEGVGLTTMLPLFSVALGDQHHSAFSLKVIEVLNQVGLEPTVTTMLIVIVLATGYKGLEALVGKFFGEKVTARVGPIWGFGEAQELRNLYVRTPQPGLWFIAGSFAQCRIYSKYLALQIKAAEAGIIDR